MTATATLTLEETRLMLERGKLVAATEDSRPALRAIHIIIADGHVRAEASDGFAMMIHRIDGDDITGNASALLYMPDMVDMLRALPRSTKKTANDPVTITLEGGYHGAITIGELTRTGIDGTFPNVSQLIPRGIEDGRSPVEQIAVNGRYLEIAGKFARGPGSGTVRFNMPDSARQPMTFTVRDSERSRAVMVVMPMFVDELTVAEFVADVLNETAPAEAIAS